ncbi:MAG: IS110 family transposase [Clostridiales bacterium]|nr:IS110 family transposase [Clostridiales bacterium]
MERIYERCCGIDVHKKMIVACFRDGRKQEVREYGTTTHELKGLTSWLIEQGCEQVAMESTSSYWKPLYNIFEISGLPAMVVNARDIKTVPGRKTDVNDAQWIADLLQHGLLRGSYIPDRDQRELREASRYRKSLVEERARELNRLQKMLEGANVKLASFASDVNGKSSRRVIDALVKGQALDEEHLKELLHGSMHKKIPDIMPAVEGVMTPMQKRLLACVIDHIDDMTKRIGDIDRLMEDYLGEYEEAIVKLDAMPGTGRQSAETILAEIGFDMSRFPSGGHLSRWAGIAARRLDLPLRLRA